MLRIDTTQPALNRWCDNYNGKWWTRGNNTVSVPCCGCIDTSMSRM